MTTALKIFAHTIYEECLVWIIDYIENEIDFKTTINYFENTKSKLFYKNQDLNECLDENKQKVLSDITNAFEDSIIEIQRNKTDINLLERELKSKLKEIID